MFEVSASLWALTDDRAGHNAHTLGLAEAIGLEFDEKKLTFNALARLPQSALGASLKHVASESRVQLSQPWPSVVIASGRRMLPVMRYIKRQSPKTKLIQCLWPGRAPELDAIVVPHHDDVLDDPRLIRFHGALHRLQSEALKSASITFTALFDPLPKPHFGVLIGGHSQRAKASLANLHHLLDTAEFLVGEGSLIITTSRRTPSGFVDAIRDRLTCEYHLHGWGSDAPNPYAAMLARCDALCVSGDSVSMMSEACATGKPVLVDTSFDSMRAKHHRAASRLIEAGHAYALRADIDVPSLAPVPLSEMARVADEVKSRLHISSEIG